MMPALQACWDHFKGRIYPGDIFISNDAYEGGSHLPDIFLFKPVFAGERIVAHLCAMAHHTDIGGRVAGGNACDSTEIYQEGLRIPPLKLRERGASRHEAPTTHCPRFAGPRSMTVGPRTIGSSGSPTRAT